MQLGIQVARHVRAFRPRALPAAGHAGCYMQQPKMRIAIVSSSGTERSALYDLLVGDGHQVVIAATPAEALDRMSLERPDTLIADVQVTGFEGQVWMRALAERGLAPRVILLCPRAARTTVRDGFVCLTKPIELDQLRRAIMQADTTRDQVA